MLFKTSAMLGVSLAALTSAMPVDAQTSTTPQPAQQQTGADPAAQSTPQVQNPGTSEDSTGSDGDIVVTGIRRSLESSQAIKRNSDAIVDAIVAEDIGKLPDVTASASLARLPGIQVSRGAGEAADVRLRGLPDLSTTYNGRDIFTGIGRGVALQDFPAAQIAALEAYKSSTANLIEGGIGGQINVRSRRPLDFDGLELFGAVQGNDYEQSTKTKVNGNVLISNRWKTGIGEIGALISASYTSTDYIDVAREADQFIATATPAQTSVPGLRYPPTYRIANSGKDFYRPSVTYALQWKPSSELEFYSDGLFQGFRGKANDRLFQVPINGSFSNVVLMPDTNQAQSMTVTPTSVPLAFQSGTNERTDTYQIAAGAVWTPERTRVSFDFSYGNSRYSLSQTNLDTALNIAPTFDIDYDTSAKAGGPVLEFRDFNPTDPSAYIFRGLFDRRYYATSEDIQTRLDVEYETNLDLLTRLQFGLRYSDRNGGERNGDRYSSVDPVTGQQFTALNIPLNQVADVVISPAAFRFDDAQQFRRFITVTPESIRRNADALRQLVGFPTGEPPINDLQRFDATEKSYTFYGQGKYGFDVAGLTVDGLVGLRVVRTKTSVAGTLRTETPVAGQPNDVIFTPVSAGRNYIDYLPNVSARVELNEGLQLRLAYTQTRSRPNFFQLTPTSTVSSVGADNYVNISSGNPDLKPLESNNYDISLEYYPTKSSSATVAVFRRGLRGFISDVQTVALTDPNDPTIGGTRFNRPENGGRGRIQGVEVAGQTTLDFGFVPDWARYFGFAASYTYLDATSALPGNNPPIPGDLSLTLPGQRALGGVSKHSYNLIGFYERPEFSVRLGYNWRSRFVAGYRNPPNLPADNPVEFDRPQYEEARGVLDLGATVTPVRNVTVAFDIANLLGNPRQVTNPYNPQGDSFPERVVYLERIYSLGVRFRF